MAITITLDTLDGASLDVGSENFIPVKRFFRPFVAEGVTAAVVGSNVSEALWLTQAAVAAAIAASPLASGRAEMIATRIFVEPFSTTVMRGRVLYEKPIVQYNALSSYLIRDSGVQRTLETNRMPGTHEPIVCTWTGTIGSGSGITHPKFSDRVTFTITAPLRSIIVNALIYGRPPGGGQEGVVSVNNASWPTSGYPGGLTGIYPKDTGYWKLDKFETQYSAYAGYYTLEAEATTKVLEDWSETGTLRNQQTGRYVAVDPADLAALLSPAYTYGIASGNGIVRVGFNPLLDFTSIFGW